jgi:hypothetical protein
MVKFTPLLMAPPEFVTDTVRVLRVALDETVNVAVIDVPAPFTTMLLALTPVPEIVIALTPVRLVPVNVTLTVVPVPRVIEVGLIDVRFGLTTLNG